MSRRRFDSLDGMRCFCILAVIWHHAPGVNALGLNMFTKGFLGVDMFFVLSGFLITTLLIREQSKHGRISLRAFWLRRCLRIFPIYYLSLAAIVLAYVTLRRGDPDTQRLLEELPFYVFYISNWRHDAAANLGPLWSLATEEQFYLIWPLIEVYAAVKLRRVLLLVLVLINIAIATRTGASLFFEDGAQNPIFALHIMQTTFLPILLGVSLAHLLHCERWYGVVSKLVSWTWAPAFWTLLMFAIIEFGPPDIQGGPRIIIQLCMMLIIASTVTQQQHILTKPLGWFVIKRIGEISYGMYLYHMWGMDAVRRLLTKLDFPAEQYPLVVFGLIVFVTIIISEISFRLIEAPILQFKKRFTRVDTGRDEPKAGAT